MGRVIIPVTDPFGWQPPSPPMVEQRAESREQADEVAVDAGRRGGLRVPGAAR